MVIYGLNFSGTPIPEEYLRMFPKETMFRTRTTYYLQGVCDTEEETQAMALVAQRPNRVIGFMQREGKYACYVGSYKS